MVPTLKDLNLDPKFPTWVSQVKDKITLLAMSWFPNKKPTINPPHPHPPCPIRSFHQVTKEEVIDTLKECTSENTPGILGLNYKVWKWVAKVTSNLLVTCWVFHWENWWVLFKHAHFLPVGFGLGELMGTF